MSEIRATTISDAAGTGPIALTKQSAAKAWVSYNNNTATPFAWGSFNSSSLTDLGVGQIQINYVSSLQNGYTSVGSVDNAAVNFSFLNQSQTDCKLYGYAPHTAAFTDTNVSCASFQGDLA